MHPERSFSDTIDGPSIDAVYVPVEREQAVRIVQLPKPPASSLQRLYEVIGCQMVEAVITPVEWTPQVTAYVDEEGKFVRSHEVNVRATEWFASVMFPADYVAGPMVIVGFNPRNGEHADLPPWLRDKLLAGDGAVNPDGPVAA